MKRAVLLVAGFGIAYAPIFSGCGGTGGNESGFNSSSGGDDATTDGASSSSSGGGDGSSRFGDSATDGTTSFGDGGSGCPSTCKQLGANCGAVTDTRCGGVIQCGPCPTGEACGGGGKHNVCGSGSGGDGGPCAPMTCAGQKLTCGMAGDGCGKTLDCGSCSLPQTCGGDPLKPGQCGCTGVCQTVPTCPVGQTTTLTGSVYDPAGVHPLYDVLVYVPNNPSDPGLLPFPAGISCDVCGATAAGDPLVTTYTAPDGTFTLSGVPVGAAVPLVIQLGHWRREFTVAIANPCAPNAAPGMLTMPKTHLEGDIPRIALLTGGLDPVECTLRKMGVADSEFTDPGGGGHINFYLAGESDPHASAQGSGARISPSTPSQPALMTTATIDQYDMVVLECEGYPQHESAADWSTLAAYTSAGGRVFSSDYAWSWFYQQTPTAMANPAYANAAVWTGAQWSGGTASNISIDLVSNPKGMAFDKWLEVVGVSVAGSDSIASIYPGFHNTGGVTPPTQQWLYWNAPPQNTPAPLHMSFNTPVGAGSTMQCGRVVYSDWHAWQPGTGGAQYPNGATFPAECDGSAMTPQQAILEFMLFDLSACVQPYVPVCTPTTCAAQHIDCGPASDGCGNLLSCGTCASGQTCGGGGSGKCGTQTTCTPETCMSQGIQCGQAGDGCGHVINCGNCPTGQICGLGGPGKCGATQ